MTDAERLADLVAALLNRWADGQWSWFCPNPAGGDSRPTREEAEADLFAWAARQAAANRKKFGGPP